jgi:uncharacterized protein YgfB (UPF0149 family)
MTDLTQSLVSLGLSQQKAEEHSEKIKQLIDLSVLNRVSIDQNQANRNIEEILGQVDDAKLKQIIEEESDRVTKEYLSILAGQK